MYTWLFNCSSPLFLLVTGKCEHKANPGRVLLLSEPADCTWFPVSTNAIRSTLETTGEIILRNYDPEDEELKKRKLPPAKPASVEDKVKDQLEAAKPETIIDEVDLTNLAPRKPDWDLKRDVAKKMEKLEKRTQRAIAELIRERLKGQEEELAAAVGSAKQDGSDSD
ncbi:coiled-coil domain-containing protein 12 isoform X2 [Meleagris gallopavo]|uniref:coiled-coil domain-containing protein 12 isoform X2 n=1 Tax=Meleagris gallopavo TaxID=9103 RepID=UPI000549A6C4|nr:coiled-coil domain-containing protein 12 isoform X2 [Meleagris gallopavo]